MRKALCLFILFLSAASISHSETITIVADRWPPFNIVPDSENEGYMVDIARIVFEEHGHKIEYLEIPWKRAILDTRNGLFNAAIGASKTDAEGFVFPDEELARNVLAFYVRKNDNWQFNGIKSLENKKLGVIAGYDYRKWLSDYIRKHESDMTRVQILTGDSPLKRNIQLLLLGRVDVVVDNEAAILWEAKQLGATEKIRGAGYGKEPAYCYIAFSPAIDTSAEYAGILSDGIKELRKSGRLQQILGKYGLKDWQ